MFAVWVYNRIAEWHTTTWPGAPPSAVSIAFCNAVCNAAGLSVQLAPATLTVTGAEPLSVKANERVGVDD